MRGPLESLSHDQREWCAAVLTAVGEALPVVEFGSPTFMRPSRRALFTGVPANCGHRNEGRVPCEALHLHVVFCDPPC